MPSAAFEWSEEYRHACEARYVAGMDEKRRANYLWGKGGVAERRGFDAAHKLATDAEEAAKCSG